MASGIAFGQPNDFAEQLMYSDEKQFTQIFPIGMQFKTGQDSMISCLCAFHIRRTEKWPSLTADPFDLPPL